MDIWIDADYADEFAVVAAWLGVLVPWNITYFAPPGLGNFLFVRFPLFQVRYAFGNPISQAILLKSAPGALIYQTGGSLFAEAYRAWVAGAIIFGIAVLLSLALYFGDDRLSALSTDFSRVMGWLILAAGIALTVSSYHLITPSFSGGGVVYIPIPLGLLGLFALAAILLFVERRSNCT